jgi:hypothetical protein
MNESKNRSFKMGVRMKTICTNCKGCGYYDKIKLKSVSNDILTRPKGHGISSDEV